MVILLLSSTVKVELLVDCNYRVAVTVGFNFPKLVVGFQKQAITGYYLVLKLYEKSL